MPPLIRVDVSQLERLVPALQELSAAQRERVIPRALNDVMDGVYTRVVRILAEETGAQQKRVRGIMRKRPARPGILKAEIVARDEFMSLKDFRPSQRKAGVSASPWGERKVFPRTFFGPGGHVYKRISSSRLPIERLYGPAIPRQMLRGKTEEIVHEVVQARFVPRLSYWTDKETGRIKAKYRV